ncbi:MAG: histidine phosphatase family protein [Cellulomonadaceae bacterium]|jgi:probable phosphoglycerate mutase|nr:histidine phosphatase family protein [Cellulomonadaceae bacterium]
MTAKWIVLWRHGRTAWNAVGRLQGQSDIEMDSVGFSQVEANARALAAAFPGAVVVSSDLRRASDTARVYCELAGGAPTLDERLRERSFGVWEGLDRAEIARQWPDLFEAWQRGSDALAVPPQGESRSGASRRIADAIVERAEALPDNATLLVVSHGAAITGAITYLIGEDPDNWHGVSGLDNANWSVLKREHTQTEHDQLESTQPESTHAQQPKWRLAAHNVGNTPLNDIYNG